jgi:hypothetical protein
MAQTRAACPAEPASFGEIAALVGEIYLIMLAVLVVSAAVARAVDVPATPAAIEIYDPATAANFTA